MIDAARDARANAAEEKSRTACSLPARDDTARTHAAGTRVAAPTELGEFARVAMKLLDEEGAAGHAEVRRRLDEMRWVGLDPRANLVFHYNAEEDQLARLEPADKGVRRAGSFGRLRREPTDFQAERILTELVPSGALIYAIDAEGRRSPIAILFALFEGGVRGPTISYDSDDATLEMIRARPASAL